MKPLTGGMESKRYKWTYLQNGPTDREDKLEVTTGESGWGINLEGGLTYTH